MRIFKLLTGLILLLFLAVAVGDYMNLPLWPTDWLKPSYPIEIKFDIAGVNEEHALRLFKQSTYSELFLCTVDGRRIRPLELDRRGVSRFVIEEGSYSLEAFVTSVDQNEWYLFTHQPDETGQFPIIRTQYSGQVIPLTLIRKIDLENESKNRILAVYLQKGDLKSAIIVAADISEETLGDMERLIEINQELDTLTIDSYTSIITRLKEIQSLFNKHGISPDDQVVLLPTETLHIGSRLKAVQDARNRVLESYIDVMSVFHQSGRLMSVLQEWNQLVRNPELYDDLEGAPAELRQELIRFKEIVLEIQKMLPEEIETNFQQGVALYEEGNLIEARKKLSRLLSFMRNLNLQDDYQEIDTSIVEYLQDIEIITTANHAIRSDDLERALMLFDLIVRPNTLVRDRIRETKRFLQIRTGKAVDNGIK